MADPFTKPYLDSSVFFALVKQEQIICPGGLTRWEVARHIFEDAQSGKYTLYTSTATIAEVKIRDFFEHQFIQPIDVTREIAEKAQELGAEHGINPIDAIHLATAIWWGCDVLLVWDKRFSQPFEGETLEGVRVTEPYWEGQLDF